MLEEISVPWLQKESDMQNTQGTVCLKSKDFGIGWFLECLWSACCILWYFVPVYWLYDSGQASDLYLASFCLIL